MIPNRVNSYSDNGYEYKNAILNLCMYGSTGVQSTCRDLVKFFKQFVILELKDVDDMDKAIALKNVILYADRDDFALEEGEYFLTDIIGLDVIDADNGKVYGKVSDIINRGASDIYVVSTPNGERMIPAVDEFIIDIDVSKGVMVRTIEGLLD